MAAVTAPVPINIVVGTTEFGPFDIPDPATVLTVSLARRTALTLTLWSPGVDVQVQVLVSLDAGVNYSFFCGLTGSGGVFILRDLITEAPATSVIRALPSGVSRKARVTLTVSGGALLSTLSIDAS